MWIFPVMLFIYAAWEVAKRLLDNHKPADHCCECEQFELSLCYDANLDEHDDAKT